jgi:hypothetical protein
MTVDARSIHHSIASTPDTRGATAMTTGIQHVTANDLRPLRLGWRPGLRARQE